VVEVSDIVAVGVGVVGAVSVGAVGWSFHFGSSGVGAIGVRCTVLLRLIAHAMRNGLTGKGDSPSTEPLPTQLDVQ
jgi:hypothetical protein